jgi:hypothetical protein
MPRSNNIKVQNNFSKGLITEATGLSFPEDACTETDNCVFEPFGVARRRLGFDLEHQFEEFTQDLSGMVVVTYLWKDVASNGELIFVVVQMGDTLHFYKVEEGSLSGAKHSNTIDLTDFAPGGITTVAELECQFSSGNGLLFVTNRRLNTFYVEYDLDGDTFSATAIDIQIRDTEGDRADDLDVDERPAVAEGGLSSAHRYNLENQGWTDANISAWDTARTDMPSNADVSWYFKNADNEFAFSTVDHRFVGNSRAPRGHFIYSIYNINRTANSGFTDDVIQFDRVTTSAFHAGRVFYAGLKSERQNSKIFFSQLVEEKSQYGKCYQINDPTSERLFDLLPSDGGVIDIIGAGEVLKMMSTLNSLMVFCSNGVWAITGSQGIGFTASDYSVNKISAVANISHHSFVDVEGTPFWWNLEGIYTLTLDPQSNAMRVVSITDPTIRTFFLDLPSESKQYARGVYDQFTKRVQWIFRSTEAPSFNERYVYDRLLNYDIISKAFYPWSMNSDNVKIRGITNVFGSAGEFVNSQVVRGADIVVRGSDNVVAFIADSISTTISVIKYLVSYNDGANRVTFAENNDETYLDWGSFDEGEEYDSYFVTGYIVRGGAIRKFQQNYINVISENDVDSSYKIRGQWNYSVAADTGKWSTAQVFNIFADSFQYKPNRIKLRGHGLACQFRIENNSNNPFNLIGWSVFETGNQWI